MPSFDITNKVDHQSLDNVLNVVKKEILNRYDFRDSKTEIDFDKKSMVLKITTENTMRLDSIQDVLISRSVKQKLDPKCFDFSKADYSSGAMVKKDIKVREGIEKEDAKKIIKLIKDSKIKVEAQVMDDQVRVTSKKIDDLQGVMAILRQSDLETPLQFTNMK